MSRLVTLEQLTHDMQPVGYRLVWEAGLTPQVEDRPLEASDLLFYLTQTTMPMAAFLQSRGLYVDGDGLHFDLQQFDAIGDVADKVISEDRAGNHDGVWRKYDLDGYEAADTNGLYVLTALRALALIYGGEASEGQGAS